MSGSSGVLAAPASRSSSTSSTRRLVADSVRLSTNDFKKQTIICPGRCSERLTFEGLLQRHYTACKGDLYPPAEHWASLSRMERDYYMREKLGIDKEITDKGNIPFYPLPQNYAEPFPANKLPNIYVKCPMCKKDEWYSIRAWSDTHVGACADCKDIRSKTTAEKKKWLLEKLEFKTAKEGPLISYSFPKAKESTLISITKPTRTEVPGETAKKIEAKPFPPTLLKMCQPFPSKELDKVRMLCPNCLAPPMSLEQWVRKHSCSAGRCRGLPPGPEGTAHEQALRRRTLLRGMAKYGDRRAWLIGRLNIQEEIKEDRRKYFRMPIKHIDPDHPLAQGRSQSISPSSHARSPQPQTASSRASSASSSFGRLFDSGTMTVAQGKMPMEARGRTIERAPIRKGSPGIPQSNLSPRRDPSPLSSRLPRATMSRTPSISPFHANTPSGPSRVAGTSAPSGRGALNQSNMARRPSPSDFHSDTAGARSISGSARKRERTPNSSSPSLPAVKR